MNQQMKPHQAVAAFALALEGVKPFICIHEEFKHDCPKCLRQEIRRLQQKVKQRP